MFKRWFSKATERVIEFCERCGVVCGSACRSARIRERALQSAVKQGWRPL